MKKVLLLAVVMLLGGIATAQNIRIVAVETGLNFITIQNFGTSAFDITGYRLKHNGNLAAPINGATFWTEIQTGSFVIAPGDVAIVFNPLLMNLGTTGDLGLFLPGATAPSAANMVDYVQYGTGGNANESMAVTAGYWGAGDFVSGTSPFAFTGTDTDYGVTFWEEYSNYAQIRISSVNPDQDLISIANYGGQIIDLTDYVVSSALVEDTVSNLTVEYGTTTLAFGELVVLSGFSLNDASGDLALYLPSPVLSDSSYLVDFTQWGAGGLGREPIAVAAEVWGAGDFVAGAAPYGYTGIGFQEGINFWGVSGLSMVATGQDPLCTGSCDGTGTAAGNGGGQPYYFTWSDGQAGGSATGLCAGVTTVLLVDSTGNSLIDTVTLANPTAIAVTHAITDAGCGMANGSVTATGSGGTAPLSYIWSSGSVTATAAGLAAGTYTVTVSDAGLCSLIDSVVIGGFTATVSTAGLPDDCAASTGSAWATATGLAPFTYVWSGAQTTDSISGLAAGTYTVTATAADGCTAIDSVAITGTAAIAASSSSTNASCGNADGSATVTPTAGQAPYTYLWDAGTGGQTDSTAAGLTAGSYTCTITDANGCANSFSVAVNDLGGVSAAISSTDANCQLLDGTASVAATGGTQPYTYLWATTAGSQTTATATGLGLGTYGVLITDNSGCVFDTLVSVDTNQVFNVGLSAVSDSCAMQTGQALATVSGNGINLQYLWSTGDTLPLVTNLFSGTYAITVTDSTGCVVETQIAVPGTPLFSLTPSETDATCQNADGSADVAVAGNGGPFTYLWDAAAGNQTDSLATALTPGTYGITVTDGFGCTNVTSVVIAGQPLPVLDFFVEDVNCFAGSDGEISLNVSTGQQPYTYAWATGDGTSSVDNLTASDYLCTVTDANGCIAIGGATVLQPLELVVTIDSTMDALSGCEGYAQLGIAGGTLPYTINWSNGTTGPIVDNLCDSVTLTAIVEDGLGCMDTVSTFIAGPNGIAQLSAAASFTMYPNPAQAMVSFQSSGAPIHEVYVLNVLGSVVLQKRFAAGETQLMVSELPVGTYVVRVELGANSAYQRLVITK